MSLNLFTIDIRLENDVVLARQKARIIAAALKFDSQDQTRIATAVSEIARNTFQYGGGGRAEFRIEDGPDKMLVVTLRDSGRGIPNLDEILDGKYVSQTGMGVGVIGAKRLMDRFQVETRAGQGTSVTLGKRLPPKFARLKSGDMEQMLASIEKASQDPYEELKQQNKELINAMQELRAHQEELAQLNRELDETNRGVVALYAELNEKADFLQRASQLKSHFLSNMSHEFRTPLNSIAALSQILLDKLDGELTTEQEKQVGFIRRSAQDLTDLVNDLLDLAKVEAGKVNIRPYRFQVASLFAALRGMLRPLLTQNSSINLVFEDADELPEIYSDEAKISQILRNFISNALKFTERGEVRVTAKAGHNDTIVFAVQDTGIGIAAEDRERIFEEWTQVEGKLQKTVKGTGLGLPLSRKFAQLLGGEVYVKSELGAGSTFFAVVPITFNGSTDVVYVPELKREIASDKLPILVVEDNREALFIYEKYFKGTRYQLVPALTLKDARDTLRELRPVSIVLDVLLNGEHSWELLQELKHDAATANIPIFVVRDLATEVLIIDDDEVSRYLVKNVLAHMNFRFDEATNGLEGLRKARQQQPDAIILDLSMPDLSGFEVLSRLKAEPITANIPVFIYTSKMLDEDERGLLHDAVAVLSKESKSRERSLELFTQAFQTAGIPISLRTINEGQHV
jgi:signal transduction histidine kinase/CheY-like chemotaxis protein